MGRERVAMLDDRVFAELRAKLPRSNTVISLLTVGDDLLPNVCLLSPYQVLARDERVLLIAVYSGSRTHDNLTKRGIATLLLFIPPAAYYIKGRIDHVGFSGGNEVYRLHVSDFSMDYYEKAHIVSNVMFDVGAVLAHYTEVYEKLAELSNG